PDGYAKPNRQMFDLALAELNCEAAEVLHVGDHLISDVQGAKQAGLSACWIHTPQQRLSQQRVTCLPDVAISSLADLKFFID
ncbi:MAG: HAD family hydrolase, partial [Vibrio sp.]